MATAEDIRREFDHAGLSISAWAEARGFSKALVYRVLSGKRQARRGQTHQIAVALGLKDGIACKIRDLSFERRNAQNDGDRAGAKTRHRMGRR